MLRALHVVLSAVVRCHNFKVVIGYFLLTLGLCFSGFYAHVRTLVNEPHTVINNCSSFISLSVQKMNRAVPSQPKYRLLLHYSVENVSMLEYSNNLGYSSQFNAKLCKKTFICTGTVINY